MKRIMSVLLIGIWCCVALTGCWSQRELNELSIAFALGLDFVDGQYVVTAQIINPGEISPSRSGGGGDQSPVGTYETRGETLFEAFRRLTKVVPRTVYFAYVRIVVIGESLAREEGIMDSMDFLLREDEFRTDYYLLVAKNSFARDTLRVLTHLNQIPAEKVFDSLEMSEKYWAATGKITIDELVNRLIQEGRQPVLTAIEVAGNKAIAGSSENVQSIENNAVLKLANMAAFNGDKMVGWLNEAESKGYNYTQNNVNDTIATIPCPEKGSLAIEVLNADTKVRTEISNGQPRGHVDVHAEGRIGDVECEIDLSKEQTMITLEKLLKQEIRENIAGSVRRAQKDFRSDIFGFGEALFRSDPQAWASLERKWRDTFSDMPVDITVDVDVRSQGSMTKSLKQLKKER